MKNSTIITILVFALTVIILSSCTNLSSSTKMTIQMEMNKNYDDNTTYINEKLIYVSEDTDTLKLDVSFQMKAENGILEIADNETGEIFWSQTWSEDVDKTGFTISLDNLDKDKEYVIRFTATKLNYTKIIITSDNSLVKERERPLKHNKN